LLFEDFETGPQVFVLELCVGELDVFFFGERGEGRLDGEDDEGGKGEFYEGQDEGGVDIDMEVVEEVNEMDKTDDEDKVDKGLDGECEGGACVFEPVGDPLVDRPEEQEEEEAEDPGADDAARFDVGGKDVVIEQADTRHEEGAEDRKEDLPACLSG